MRLRRRYISTAAAAATDPNFGPAFTTPDPFTLTTTLYIRFGMRLTSLANATAHQWGQWGTNGNRSWGYSIHGNGSEPEGRPRLAVYPDGTDASLIGLVAGGTLEGTLGPLTLPIWLWVDCFVELDDGAGNRRFTYRAGRHNGGLVPLGPNDGVVSEAGATSFFNSTAVLQASGLVGSACDRYVDLEIRDRPGGTILVDPAITRQQPLSGAGTVWIGPDGRTYTCGGFAGLVRSPVPRPCAA